MSIKNKDAIMNMNILKRNSTNHQRGKSAFCGGGGIAGKAGGGGGEAC